MNCNALAAIIGGGSALLGVLITSIFNHISKKSEHANFVKRMRLEKIIELYDALLFTIIKGRTTIMAPINGVNHEVNGILLNPSHFYDWYMEFMGTWYTKQHYFDPRSQAACQALRVYFNRFLLNPDDIRTTMQQLTPQDVLKLTAELRPLLSACYSALNDYWSHGIERS